MCKEDEGVLLEHYIHMLFAASSESDLVAYVGLAGLVQLRSFRNRVYKWCERVAVTRALDMKITLLASQSLLIRWCHSPT